MACGGCERPGVLVDGHDLDDAPPRGRMWLFWSADGVYCGRCLDEIAAETKRELLEEV